jgi:hypothetical protein
MTPVSTTASVGIGGSGDRNTLQQRGDPRHDHEGGPSPPCRTAGGATTAIRASGDDMTRATYCKRDHHACLDCVDAWALIHPGHPPGGGCPTRRDRGAYLQAAGTAPAMTVEILNQEEPSGARRRCAAPFEVESDALGDWLDERTELRWITSALAEVELLRAIRAVAPEGLSAVPSC